MYKKLPLSLALSQNDNIIAWNNVMFLGAAEPC